MKKYIYIAIIVLIITLTLGVFKYKSTINQKNIAIVPTNIAFLSGLIGNDPKPMQNLFLQKVKLGIKDEDANSFAYWIWHRYYDNGGDIYEIYNFIQLNPELAFLNEAEILEPLAFKEIRDKESGIASVNSFKAFIAYVTVLDNYGYTNAPIITTLASKNITFARENKEGPEYKKEAYDNYVSKANTYMQKSEKLVNEIIESNFASVKNKQDGVVSVNQYLDALTEYKVLGIEVKTKYTMDELFTKTNNFAKDNVKVLYFFTGYNRAVSLFRLGDKDKSKYEESLSPIAKYDYINSSYNKPGNMLYKIVISKGDINYDIGYSYRVIVGLSEMYPEFKNWLIRSGWSEADFKK